MKVLETLAWDLGYSVLAIIMGSQVVVVFLLVVASAWKSTSKYSGMKNFCMQRTSLPKFVPIKAILDCGNKGEMFPETRQYQSELSCGIWFRNCLDWRGEHLGRGCHELELYWDGGRRWINAKNGLERVENTW